MIIDLLPDRLRPYVLLAARVGSRATVNPPPTDTDIDILVLINTSLSSFRAEASQIQGVVVTGSMEPEARTASEIVGGQHTGGFASIKHGHYDIIATPSLSFFKSFITASSLAKTFNLHSKQDRIDLFGAVMRGVILQRLPVETAAGDAFSIVGEGSAPLSGGIGPAEMEAWFLPFGTITPAANTGADVTQNNDGAPW